MTMTDLTGKVALVTGSARGIGRAIAERYANLGADIVINYSKDKTGAGATVARIHELGVKAIAVQADVARVDDVRHLFETAQSAFGKIDIAVANAGVEHTGLPVSDFTEEQYDQMFAVNTKGAFFTMQSAAGHVADNGRIIYISSSTTGYPMPGYALHGGSKVAPSTWCRSSRTKSARGGSPSTPSFPPRPREQDCMTSKTTPRSRSSPQPSTRWDAWEHQTTSPMSQSSSPATSQVSSAASSCW
jgi:NAD(P)-dependent dehydrogenase (short-subunit alcohol dehydrogenase family)